MGRIFISLCNDIHIYSYGVCIALGIILFITLVSHDYRFKKLYLEPYFSSIVILGFLSALLGARLLYWLETDESMTLFEICNIQEGGFSVLGSLIGFFTIIPLYLQKKSIPIFPCFDLMSLYAPLLQSISRIGCFFAGCCYGLPTNKWWAIVYTDPDSMAPLFQAIHPTQLYSSGMLAVIFIILYVIVQKRVTKPGQITGAYIVAVAAERFITEFWRADFIFYKGNTLLTGSQWVALAFGIAGLVCLFNPFVKSNTYIEKG